jgi:hypothetical protein
MSWWVLMKLFFKAKDGGSESKVTGYWLIESKRFGSVVLLKFDKGSREAYHNHAFNAVSWVLKGKLFESIKRDEVGYNVYEGDFIKPSLIPFKTPRERMHRVYGEADTTWALSFRGPWEPTWKEYLPKEDKEITLSNGRVEVLS